MRSLAFLFIALMGCGTLPHSLDPSSSGESFVGELRAQRFTLRNGLRVIVVEDHSSPTFAYQTWFNVGSKNETKGKSGMAHFFEHMTFQATKNHPEGEVRRLLLENGAENLNAFTGQDYTAYIQQLPRERLELVAKLEADRLENLVINQKALKTEIEVVNNERRFRYENNPGGKMHQELLATAYPNHPYGIPIIGFQKELNAFSVQDALEFYNKNYGPENALIVVVGGVSAKDVHRYVKKYYGHIDRKINTHRPSLKISAPKKARRKTLSFPLQTERLLMGFIVPELRHSDQPAIEVLQAVLSDGKGSRLEKSIVDAGIATSISSGSYQNEGPSVFIFSANLHSGKRANSAEAAILRELARLRNKKVSQEELERAKSLVQFQHYLRLAGNYGKAHFIGQYELTLGNFQQGLELYRKIEDVDQGDLTRVAKNYFTPEKRTTIIGVPQGRRQ